MLGKEIVPGCGLRRGRTAAFLWALGIERGPFVGTLEPSVPVDGSKFVLDSAHVAACAREESPRCMVKLAVRTCSFRALAVLRHNVRAKFAPLKATPGSNTSSCHNLAEVMGPGALRVQKRRRTLS